ncbi:MAG: putative rane protein [Gemmatimonadetes bacterium]|nr:putative rane protein [Gemmatimonadota bacterium]
MSAAWLLYALVIGATLAVGASAADSLCRHLRLPTRWVWMAALALLFVFIAIRVRPDGGQSLDLNALAARASAATTATYPDRSLLGNVARTLALAGTLTRSSITAAVRRLPPWMEGGASVLLVVTAIVALSILAFVHLRLRRARRGWPVAELHGATVRIAPSIGPAVVGVLRPEIVVPRWLIGRSADEQRLVLEHEREHLRRGDHLLLGAATVAVALLPWHPAVWWIVARLRLAIELDCDARVLRRGVPARTYGTLLIDMAGQCSGFRVGATALADEGSHLERRLLAMNRTRANFSVPRIGALCAAIALALLAACEAKMPTSAEIQAMDVGSVQRSAAMTPFMSKSAMEGAIFFVDGVRTDARAAHALTPNQIATVNVTKGASDAVPSTIYITTTGEPMAKDVEGHAGMLQRVHSMLGPPMAGHTMKFDIRAPAPASSRKMAGMLFVNGVRSDEAVLRRLDPTTIESVDVIKGPEAVRLYKDTAAANGVIKITTKR